GDHTFIVSAKVTGKGGARIRKWRAQACPDPIPTWLMVLGPLVGIFAWGGGLRVHVHVVAGSGSATCGTVPPEVEVHTIYRREEQDSNTMPEWR
ncbi:MAG: hypothetical protein FWD57_15790, partial [Polyangiaceae bacterium]|nr:hypothetical protein [Polyangiaceae bacterium]